MDNEILRGRSAKAIHARKGIASDAVLRSLFEIQPSDL